MAKNIRNLNEQEIKVLECLGQQVIDCTGNEFGYISDTKTPIGMTRNQFKGYVGSLVKKRYIIICDELDGQFILA